MNRDTIQSCISALRHIKLQFLEKLTSFEYSLCVLYALDAQWPLELGLCYSHFTDEGTKAK